MITLKPQESHFKLKSQTDNKASLRLICQPQADYTKESERLKSFVNWPNKEIEPTKLVKAGFYYLGIADIVRCIFCNAEGHQWVRTDDPMEDHKQWSPNCSFVRRVQRSENNEQQPPNPAAVGQDTCGKECIEIFPKSVADDELLQLEKYGAAKTKGPRHKDMVIYDSRLKTFDNWPKSMKQKPAELAEAGFFYRGTGDQTLCFHCGGGLNDWEESDNPWEQHALWFPKCNYLLLKKGQAFVDKVKQETLPKEVVASTSSSNNQQAKELLKSESSSSAASAQKQSSEDESGNTTADTRLCKICYKNEMGVLFLPCGHIVACVDCATALTTCAVCRKKVEATVRAFLS